MVFYSFMSYKVTLDFWTSQVKIIFQNLYLESYLHKIQGLEFLIMVKLGMRPSSMFFVVFKS
jgi:hypothetical protein